MRREENGMTEDQAVDRMLDVLLEEAVGQSAPPDLRARVLERHRQQQSQVLAAPAPQRRRAFRVLTSLAALAALLACFVIGYEVYLASRAAPVITDADPGQHVERSSAPATGPPAAGTPGSPPGASDGELASESPGRTEPAPRVALDLDRVPFGHQPSPPETRPPAQEPGPQRVARLSDDEIVGRLDSLLDQAWQNAGVAPGTPADPAVVVDRLAGLLNLQLSGQQRQQAEESIRGGHFDRVAARAVSDSAASTTLAAKWTDQLLGATAAERLPAEQRGSLLAAVESVWRGQQPYRSFVQRLLTSSGSSAPDDPQFDPLTVFFAATAVPDATVAVDRIGHMMLGIDLTCSRCHDHPLRSDLTQSDYWAVAATISGSLQFRADSKGNLQVDRKAISGAERPVAFYETPDGRQQMASASIPEGLLDGSRPPVTDLQELAGAIAEGRQLASATANQVWELVLGRPLVRDVSDPEAPAADPALESLHDLLTDQILASDYDLRRAVTWVVRSRPFRLQSLQATEETAAEPVDSDQLRRYFAAYAGKPRRMSRRQLLAAAQKFNARSLPDDLDQYLLAQISGTTPAADQQPKVASDRLAGLREGFPSADDSQLPAAWLADIGAFDQQAAHLFYLAGSHRLSRSDQALVETLHESTGQDSVRTLLQLWWILRTANHT